MSSLWDTEVPWPEPMNETEAAKAVTAWEQRLREERDGRDLPPEPGDGDKACPVCTDTSGFRWMHGERYECRGCGEVFSAQEIGK